MLKFSFEKFTWVKPGTKDGDESFKPALNQCVSYNKTSGATGEYFP